MLRRVLRHLLRRLLRRLLSHSAAAHRGDAVLLAAATALFLAVTMAGVHGIALGYVQAGAEAAIVGGVAGWFAVTALFRRPLGLKLPHTALIIGRKDQFAAALGKFVQVSFLNADAVAERIRSARLVPCLAAWLADPDNSARLADHAADLLVTAAQGLRDEHARRMLVAELARSLEAVEAAPLAGRALRVILAGGRHAELLSTAVSAADRYLADHHAELRMRFESEAASNWMPGPVYRLVFDRLYARLRQRLAAVAADPGDRARRQFDEWLLGLPDRLETSPELRERGERLKRDVLTSARLRHWSTSPRQRVRRSSPAQAAEPGPGARSRLTGVLTAAGRRLGSDGHMEEAAERILELGARALADQFGEELAVLVTRIVAQWDADDVSSQLELLLRPDLQYIRVNGTLVGTGVGLALHALALALT
jgi:uncharacterized membrane-anchored protein YjiN (DUF445 family)